MSMVVDNKVGFLSRDFNTELGHRKIWKLLSDQSDSNLKLLVILELDLNI